MPLPLSQVLVRCSAITCMVGLMDVLPPEVRKSKLLPFLRQQCQSLEMEPDIQRCLARLFPTILTKVGRV